MRDDLTAYEAETFGSPPMGRRQDDVDAFIAHVVALEGPLTADDVHNVAFSKPALFKRGYNEDEVDAFLDDVEATIAKLDRRR